MRYVGFVVYPRFSMKMLMFITLIVALWAKWFATDLLEKRKIVASLRHAGASVYYDYQCEYVDAKRHLLVNPLAPPPGPKWIYEVVGSDFFATPCHVQLSDDIESFERLEPDSIVLWIRSLEGLVSVNAYDGVNVVSQPPLGHLQNDMLGVTFNHYTVYIVLSEDAEMRLY